jgi:Sulfotransferase family
VKKGASHYAGAADRPIFIGACPRSGTTLLRTMLNSHPDIALPRETRFLPVIWDHRPRWRNLDEQSARERLGEAIADDSWTRSSRFETPLDELVKRIAAAPPTLGSIFGTCFVLFAEATGKRRWGDKRPMYARYLDAIFSSFPDAQYINCVRDPRASIASMRTVGWYDGAAVPGLDLWNRSVRAVDPWRSTLHPDQFMDLRYEDFVSDPETSLKEVASFLTLSPESIPVMLDYQEHVDETAMGYHSRLKEPVTTESVRAWESVLEPEEIALIEHVSGPQMDAFGYERVAAGQPPPADLLASYKEYARGIAEQRRTLEIEEFKRLFIYRDPVAARLTDGQLRIGERPSMPPFWKRHIGKPR